jgi:hypothetical protein
LLIICDISVKLFITSLFIPAIVGISILSILPDNTRVVSSPLFSSCPKDGILKLDVKANNARNIIEMVLVTAVQNVVLCPILDMKKDG